MCVGDTHAALLHLHNELLGFAHLKSLALKYREDEKGDMNICKIILLPMFLLCNGRLQEDGPLLAPRYGTAELNKCHLIIN